MKTHNKILLGLLGVMALTTGCKDKMVEINTNPDVLSDSKVQFMFTKATENYGNESRNDLISKFSGPMQLMQYLASFGAGQGAPTQEVGNPTGSSIHGWTSDYDRLKDKGATLKHIVDYCDNVEPIALRPEYNDVRAIADFMLAQYQWKVLQNFGAFPYTEGFTAIETDNLTPKYQTLTDKLESGITVWKDIDNRFAAAIKTLEADALESGIKLGENDFFNGWWKGAKTSYAQQRGNWRKYMNMFRLEMAWVLKKIEPNHFETVKTQVLAVKDGLMTKMEDGTYFNYSWSYDSNPDDVDVISQDYAIGDAFMNTLMRLDDPRIPLFARPNAANEVSSRNYRAMKVLFPDSLAKYPKLDGLTYFVSATNNPKVADKFYYPQTTRPGFNFMSRITKQFKLTNPNGDKPLTFFDTKTQKLDTIEQAANFTVELQVASSAQGRYFVKCGGKLDKNGPSAYISESVNEYRFDGKGGEFADLRLRKPVFTYAKQCFMLAVLEITAGGKSPAQWYAEGVKTALVEFQQDAEAYEIQVVANEEFPKFPGLNDAGLYKYDDAAISAYLAANPYNGIQKSMEQAWIYFYQQPETMYQWWMLTGYPHFKEHTTPEAAVATTTPYLEQMYKDVEAKVKLEYPRRAVLPDRAALNGTNYEAIKQQLLGQPHFGKEMNETLGRQWWDVK